MEDVTFVRTRHVYDSYSDFWRLVELSGFPVVYVDEIDLHNPSQTYIVCPMNGELRSHLNWSQGKSCKIFLWNLERPSGSGGIKQFIQDNLQHKQEGFIDHIIVSDLHLSQQTGFAFVPVGSHPDLGVSSQDHEKDFDFIHLMCYSPRRGPFFQYPNTLTDVHGMKIAPNGWGEERHNNLQRSKFMLNVHQDDYRVCEPLRFALAAAYALPVLTESCVNTYPYDISREMMFENGRVFDTMANAVRKYDQLRTHGANLHTQLTKHFTFARCLEAFL